MWNKTPLCAKSASKRWPTVKEVNSFSNNPSWSLKDMLLAERGNKCTAKCSTGSETSASWVLVPRRLMNKNRESQCTFVLGASRDRGAKYAGGLHPSPITEGRVLHI